MKELLKKVWQWVLDQTDWDEKIEAEFKEHQAKTNILDLNEQILKHMC